MNYYSYMRISTESQADANGVQMQQKVISDYCKNNNIE
jgi:DNA invertase Pin-like site-specific DNA recombinase